MCWFTLWPPGWEKKLDNRVFEIMKWPLLASLLLPGILVYYGLHIVRREIIFVDLALAQVAALGICGESSHPVSNRVAIRDVTVNTVIRAQKRSARLCAHCGAPGEVQ